MGQVRIQPDEFTKEQHHRIGISVPDDWDRLWSYCMFEGGSTGTTFNVGTFLVDAASSDLITGGTGTLTRDAAIGTNLLVDADEFASKDLRGAIGVIKDGPGKGQTFQVLQRRDDDTLQIALLWGWHG